MLLATLFGRAAAERWVLQMLERRTVGCGGMVRLSGGLAVLDQIDLGFGGAVSSFGRVVGRSGGTRSLREGYLPWPRWPCSRS